MLLFSRSFSKLLCSSRRSSSASADAGNYQDSNVIFNRAMASRPPSFFDIEYVRVFRLPQPETRLFVLVLPLRQAQAPSITEG